MNSPEEEKQRIIDDYVKWIQQERAKVPQQPVQQAQTGCPSCGACPTCGRGGQWTWPYNPWYPNPQITWYWPNTTTSGTTYR